jgi:hypothetical protein
MLRCRMRDSISDDRRGEKSLISMDPRPAVARPIGGDLFPPLRVVSLSLGIRAKRSAKATT